MAPGKIKVRRFDDYVAALEKAKVVLDSRKAALTSSFYDARDLALAQGLELVEDEALLHEVAGLVEWPVVLTGEFDAAFLDIPPRKSSGQRSAPTKKCFVLKDPSSGRLSHKFVLVANIETDDGGAAIAAGNGRVVQARLSDAKFFGRPTLKLESSMTDWPISIAIDLSRKLGTQGERAGPTGRPAREIAPYAGAELLWRDARRASRQGRLLREWSANFPDCRA